MNSDRRRWRVRCVELTPIANMKETKIAVAQMGSVLGDVRANLARVGHWIKLAAEDGISLTVFPECILSGYIFRDRKELSASAVRADGPELAEIEGWCKSYNTTVIVGYCELASDGLFNSAAVIGPQGTIGTHRKRHLPFIGADRFMDEPPGTKPAIFNTSIGRVGVGICYEIRFPEVFRTLALAGAEIIALPTNWPEQSEILATHFTRVRAAENFVYVLAANRYDTERDVRFLGASQIVDPTGHVRAHAERKEGLFSAAFDPQLARNKRIVFREGEFEVSPWRDRRPQTYCLD
jgi:predicted amidohydrolase